MAKIFSPTSGKLERSDSGIIIIRGVANARQPTKGLGF